MLCSVSIEEPPWGFLTLIEPEAATQLLGALTVLQQRTLLYVERRIFCKIRFHQSSVVDPHHLDADPDSTYHPDADPDSDFI
jgi:hypothetical protein